MSPSKFAKFTCEICDQTLLRKQSYQAHMRSHRADKDFKCTACGKGFGSKAWLTRHLKTHPLSEDRSSSSRSPFTILPREIWCMIMENMPFTDTSNLFKAYPEMKTIYKKKKQLWLFDQVIPFIAEWVGELDILDCRLVSYKWKEGVDNFLEKSLFDRPYDPDNPVTGKLWGPRNYYAMCCNFHELQGYEGDYSRSVRKLYQKFPQWYRFRYVEELQNFKQKMIGHSSEINPFVGRYVELMLSYGDPLKRFWKAVKDFLKIWGKHIWFFRVEMEMSHWQIDTFVVNFVKCLEYLPNVKRLNIRIDCVAYRTIVDESCLEQKSIKLANLPHLEAIQLSCSLHYSVEMSRMLLPNNFEQVRRIQFHLIDIEIHISFRGIPSTNFRLPNLRELQIIRIRVEYMVKLNNVLLFLEAAGLHSLDLKFWARQDCRSTTITTSEIFQWLNVFPELKHLSLEGGRLRITGPYGGFLNGSVKSICLYRTALNSTEFFHCFQALQCLQIYVDADWGVGSTSTRKDFYKLFAHDEAFWKDLPKLRKLIDVIVKYGHFLKKRKRFFKTEIEAFLNSHEGK